MPVTELTERRTADTKTYDLGNGQQRLVCGGGNSHFLNEQTGLYEDVDYSALESPVTAGFTHYFSKGQFRAEIDAVNGILRIYPVRGDNAKYLEVRAHPTNRISVNVEVFHQKAVRIYKNTTNVNYNWLLSDRGFKVYLYLKTSAAPSSYTFGFRLVNLQRSGRRVFDGENFIGTLPNAWLEDANGVRRDVIETMDDVLGRVTLDADLSGLTFPVTIDPTLTVQSTGCTDTYLTSFFPNTPLSYLQYFKIGTYDVHPERALLSFDATVIPTSAIITNAQLGICIYTEQVWKWHLYLDCGRPTRTDWVEAEATWNVYKAGSNWTSPGGDYDMSIKDTAVHWQYTGGNVWIYFNNVLPHARYWQQNGGVNHFFIKRDNETADFNYGFYFSRTYVDVPSRRPKLIIDYTESSGYPIISRFRKTRRLV